MALHDERGGEEVEERRSKLQARRSEVRWATVMSAQIRDRKGKGVANGKLIEFQHFSLVHPPAPYVYSNHPLDIIFSRQNVIQK